MGPDVEVSDAPCGALLGERRVAVVNVEQVGLRPVEVHCDVQVGSTSAGHVAEHHAMTTEHRRRDARSHRDVGERQGHGRYRRWRRVRCDEGEGCRPRAIRAVELGADSPPVAGSVLERGRDTEAGLLCPLADYAARGQRHAGVGVIDLEEIGEDGGDEQPLGVLRRQNRRPGCDHRAAGRCGRHGGRRLQGLGLRGVARQQHGDDDLDETEPACSADGSDVAQSAAKAPRCTEGPDAPGDQGVTGEHAGSIRKSNYVGRADTAPIECRGTCTTGR